MAKAKRRKPRTFRMYAVGEYDPATGEYRHPLARRGFPELEFTRTAFDCGRAGADAVRVRVTIEEVRGGRR